MDVTWKVSGLQELGERMRTLKEDLAKKIAVKATARAAQVVKFRAIQNVITSPSVETGSLRDAIVAKKVTRPQLTSEHIVTVRVRSSGRKTKTKQPSAPHAHFVEYGTVKMPAEPFLRPALSEHKEEAAEAMRQALEQGIGKAGA